MSNLLAPIWLALEGSRLARTIASSTTLTAGLSAVHLVGFTLLMGSAIVSNLTLAGVLFRRLPLVEVREPAGRGLMAGLAISVATGVLLFSGRATAASRNDFFQLKMLALAAACVCQFALQRRFVSSGTQSGVGATALGIVGLVLWFGVAAAACAFILLEE